MTRSAEATVVVPPIVAGRLAAGFLSAGAAVAVVDAIVALMAGRPTLSIMIAGIGSAALAVAAWFAPWDRWDRRATLVLLVPGLALLAFTKSANANPYLAGVFFVVIGVWTGLCHRRYTTLALAPLLALGFGLPLFLSPHLGNVVLATVIVTCVTVFVGEVLALLRVRLERAHDQLLEARERRFGALGQGSSDVSIIFNTDGAITYVSPGARTTFGYDPAEVQRIGLLEFMSTSVDRSELSDWPALLTEATASTANDLTTETRVRHKDGHWMDVETLGQDRTDDPDISGFIYNVRDISARKQLERRLQRQAFFDDLTGLPNRLHFSTAVAAQIAGREPISVLFIDLDGFKAINDSAGHDIGDQLLKLVAARLDRLFDHGATLARFGGDEFAAIAPTNDANRARDVAATVVNALKEPFRIGLRSIVITASVGVASNETGDLTAADLVRAADTAMYVAKASSTQRVVAYDPAMRDRLTARLNTEAEIREAIDDHQFVLHYQPIIDFSTGRSSGAEALIRWRHPAGGLLPPAAFIEIAESCGLIIPMGRWVIHQACRDAAGWQRSDREPIRVAVNVSARQFQDPGLVNDIRAALMSSGLDPTLLEVEVTESVLVGDLEPALARLEELRSIGVLLALDDFGTGYSSLSYLQALPFDVLKIDKSFVDHITSNPSDLALMRTINQLGHDLNLHTLAEGIETAEQERAIRAVGVDYGQGFLYEHPLPIDELHEYLNRCCADAPVHREDTRHGTSTPLTTTSTAG